MWRVYVFFGGRSMTAFWIILGIGAALAFQGKLTPEFAGLVSVILICVNARAVSEDKYLCGKQCPSPDAQTQAPPNPAST
jgi:hypothetical protein